MKFVTIHQTQDEIEARMICEFLRARGFQCLLSAELPTAVYHVNVQDVALQVPAAEADRARELIEAFFSEAFDWPEREDP